MRVNFNYFISDPVRDYLIDAVDLAARYGHRLLGDYRFDPHTGLWHHRSAPAEPPLRLAQLRYDADVGLTAPGSWATAGEDALAGYLEQARAGPCWPAGPTGSTTAPPACPTTSSGCAGSTSHLPA